jgi:hypothetical protein
LALTGFRRYNWHGGSWHFGHDIFRYRLFHKTRWSIDFTLPVITPASPSLMHAGIMIDMTMGINNGNNRAFATMLNVKIHVCFGRFADTSGSITVIPFALYNRHIRQIEVTDLVDAFRDLKQTANIIQLRLTPQARVDGIRRFLPFFDKSVFPGGSR